MFWSLCFASFTCFGYYALLDSRALLDWDAYLMRFVCISWLQNCSKPSRKRFLEERLSTLTDLHQVKIPYGGNKWNFFFTYMQNLMDVLGVNRAWWMKGNCLIWSRDRHFSPFMPGREPTGIWNFSSQYKRSVGRNLVGYSPWYAALDLAPRLEILLTGS